MNPNPSYPYNFIERKLSNADKVRLLNDYIQGMPIDEIAEKYNVHKSLPAKMAARQGIPRRR